MELLTVRGIPQKTVRGHRTFFEHNLAPICSLWACFSESSIILCTEVCFARAFSWGRRVDGIIRKRKSRTKKLSKGNVRNSGWLIGPMGMFEWLVNSEAERNHDFECLHAGVSIVASEGEEKRIKKKKLVTSWLEEGSFESSSMLHYKHHSNLPNGPDGCSNTACCQLPIATDEVFSADVCVTHKHIMKCWFFWCCLTFMCHHNYKP